MGILKSKTAECLDDCNVNYSDIRIGGLWSFPGRRYVSIKTSQHQGGNQISITVWKNGDCAMIGSFDAPNDNRRVIPRNGTLVMED